MKFKIKEEYEALLPSLPPEEYSALKESIKENGLYSPITINPEGYILDGHNRFKICNELEITAKYEVKEFENPLLEKRFVIEANLKRRHLTPFQKIEMALPLLGVERELAKERQRQGGMYKSELTANLQEAEATEVVAERIGVSPRTFYMANTVIEEATEEDKQKLRAGEVAISAVYKGLVHEKRINELKEKTRQLVPPEGEYQVIVIDPPWPYGTEYNSEGRRVASPYPEMEIEELEKLEIPSTENCILWLWTTNRFMHNAFHLLEAWGFEPKTILTWVKSRMGIGEWLRGKTEHCILAVKGKPVINLTNQTTALFGNSKKHSEKPNEFYLLVDTLCIGKKLDYFARETRKGWDVYGTRENE